MIDYQLKLKIKDIAQSLITKYDMFYTNRHYKTRHFKSIDEYESIQKSLAFEIQMEESMLKELLIKYFKENCPLLNIKLYDSRTICLTKMIHNIGKILIDDIGGSDTIESIRQMFKDDTDFVIDITSLSELDEETRLKLKETFNF